MCLRMLFLSLVFFVIFLLSLRSYWDHHLGFGDLVSTGAQQQGDPDLGDLGFQQRKVRILSKIGSRVQGGKDFIFVNLIKILQVFRVS